MPRESRSLAASGRATQPTPHEALPSFAYSHEASREWEALQRKSKENDVLPLAVGDKVFESPRSRDDA